MTDLSNLLGLGGLRLCTAVVMLAAQVAGDAPIDAALLRRVVKRMHGKVHTGQCIESRMERSAVRYAAAS